MHFAHHAAVTAETLTRSLRAANTVTEPFAHWRPRGMLDGDVAVALAQMPIEVPTGLDLERGTREANNKTRTFFDTATQAREPAARALAEAMQSPQVVREWERLAGLDLAGSFLRIEYCRDTDGFWLEPHTDIGAKMITILIYLSTGPGAGTWGTDVYDTQKQFFGTVPGDFNCGLAFVPGEDTFHGFEKRAIPGLRRTLMLNYVKPEWRSRHELCFPERSVLA